MGGPGKDLIARHPIESARLRLEPIAPEHADGIFDAVMASRVELLPWMPWAREPSLRDTQEQTAYGLRKWESGSEFHFALIERETAAILGVMGLNAEADGSFELHYWIRSDRAGRGLTTEGCRALLDWAASQLRPRRLTLWAGRDNAASRRVAEKLGFVHLGPLDWTPEGGLGTFPAERYELRLET